MKQVHVLRHAPKHRAGGLTDEGRLLAQEYKARLEKYDLVFSSGKPRAVETAVLLTGVQPIVDDRANTPAFTLEQERQLHEHGSHHQFGIAGVIFDNLAYREMIKAKGESLIQLIKEILKKLPENGKALVISHDGVMVTAERILKDKPLDKAEKTFMPLDGFVVYEDGRIEDLKNS